MPEANEPIAIEPKIRKSLNDWTLVRSSGRWLRATIVVAPMNAKFQPIPSNVSEIQKCATVNPAIPTRAETAALRVPTPQCD